MQALYAALKDMYSTVILSHASVRHRLPTSMQQEDVWLVRPIHSGIIRLFNVLLVLAQQFTIQLLNHAVALKSFLSLIRKDNVSPAKRPISGTVRRTNVFHVQIIFSTTMSSDVVYALKNCPIFYTTIHVFPVQKERIGIPITENV